MLSRPPHYIAIVVVPMMDARLLAELWDQEKEERAEKERRLKEWEEGGNREEREARKEHKLVEDKHN